MKQTINILIWVGIISISVLSYGLTLWITLGLSFDITSDINTFRDGRYTGSLCATVSMIVYFTLLEIKRSYDGHK
jgi:hypothetical protein